MADFEANNIVKEFKTPTGETALRILNDVSLSMNRGENVSIVGESGSGKSTFLHIIGSLDRATSGEVNLFGKDVTELSESDVAAHRNKNIGFVFQQHHLLPQLSALDNVLVPTLATGKPDDAVIDRAKALLDSVGLADRASHLPGLLSGGEQQRVAVARALICDPVLLLADEPTGSLDASNADMLGDLLLSVQEKSDAMLVCVTHSDKLARKFSKTVRLENGRFATTSD